MQDLTFKHLICAIVFSLVIGIGLPIGFFFVTATTYNEDFGNITGIWNGNIVGISYGGTGANTTSTALNNLLPGQGSFNGNYLVTNGTSTSWSAVNYNNLTNLPTFAAVATTGAYASLSGLPSIPAAQLQSDWTQTNTTSATYVAHKPSLYYGSALMGNYIEAIVSTTITSTTAIFPVVTVSGTPIFTTIFPESAAINFTNSGATFANSSSTLSADRKTIIVTINKQGFSNANVLLNLLGNLTSVLSGVSYTTAPSGTVVYLDIKGN